MSEDTRVRLDKWLWAARFYKTRQLAVEAVERHRVEVNGQACKPSREVRVGDRLRLAQPGWWREVEVLGLSLQRGPAALAQQLYRDTPQSLARRPSDAVWRPNRPAASSRAAPPSATAAICRPGTAGAPRSTRPERPRRAQNP